VQQREEIRECLSRARLRDEDRVGAAREVWPREPLDLERSREGQGRRKLMPKPELRKGAYLSSGSRLASLEHAR